MELYMADSELFFSFLFFFWDVSTRMKYWYWAYLVATTALSSNTGSCCIQLKLNIFSFTDFVTSYYNYTGVLDPPIGHSSLLRGSHRSIHLEEPTPFCQPDQTIGPVL